VFRRYGREGLMYLRREGILKVSESDKPEATASGPASSKPPATGIPELDLEHGEVGDTLAEKVGDLLFGKKKKRD